MKIVGIDGGKKQPCPYCRAIPACPDFSCPRIESVWSCEETGEWEITFRDRWTEPEPAA